MTDSKWQRWQREIDAEKDPHVKAMLEQSYAEQIADMPLPSIEKQAINRAARTGVSRADPGLSNPAC